MIVNWLAQLERRVLALTPAEASALVAPGMKPIRPSGLAPAPILHTGASTSHIVRCYGE